MVEWISWQRGITYDHMCKIYVQYVERHYRKQATIIFDGYQHGPSTKDSTHQWRKVRGVGPQVKLQSSAVQWEVTRGTFFFPMIQINRILSWYLQKSLAHVDSLCTMHMLCRFTDCKNCSKMCPVQGVLYWLEMIQIYWFCFVITIIFNLHSVFIWKLNQKMTATSYGYGNIKCTQEKLGIEICRSILVLHAILGCFWEVRERYGIKKMASDNNFATAI